MPGIVGLITNMPRQRAELELARMLGTLRHESFYRIGVSVDASLGVYVGWAARESSFSDGMPLRNERGDVVLTFSGEEFPEPGTVRRLLDLGHSFDTAGAEYLVHMYEEDASFPSGLNGRFHGLLTDRARGTTMLFNDRYGLQRLYVHESKDAFYFAAEAKAILAVRPELRRIDPQGLGEFVACGCVLENRSLFRGISVLPGGSAWTFRRGAVERKETYFHPREWEDQGVLPPEPYYRQLRDTVARNLPRYFQAREPVGMSLTGGLDTRMIMAWHKAAPGSLPCYTFGSAFRDCRDVVVARRIAGACRQPHVVIGVGPEFTSRFHRYAERTVYLTDGCADVSRSPDLYVNEQARTIAPIRMTGNYGGELLRQVRAFKPVMPLDGLYRPELVPFIQAAGETYAGLRRVHPLSFAAFRQAPWHHYGLLALEETQLSLRSPYLDNDFVRCGFRAPESALASNDVSLRLIADGDAGLRRIRTDRGLAGASRWSGAASRALQELSFKAEYAFDHGMPQWLARIDKAFAPLHLERVVLGRHKFYHFRLWYRNALAAYVRDILLDRRTLARPYLNRATLERIVKGHLDGSRNYTGEIHKMLTLELVHRLLLEEPASERPLSRAV